MCLGYLIADIKPRSVIIHIHSHAYTYSAADDGHIEYIKLNLHIKINYTLLTSVNFFSKYAFAL